MDMAGNKTGFLHGTVCRTPCDAFALASLGQNIGGAGAAYRREVFEHFGPISRATLNEDMVLEFRAALLGKVTSVPLPLVRHRMHSESATGSASGQADSFVKYEAGARKMAVSILHGYEARVADLTTAVKLGLIEHEKADKIRGALLRHVAIMRNVVDLYDGRPLAYFSWLSRLLRGQMPIWAGLRSLVMSGFPRLWFWHISRRARTARSSS
jgi:hypothetical protein